MPRERPGDPEEAVAMMQRFAGVEPAACREGRSELLPSLRSDLTRHHGYAHGAVVGMMADNACAWATSSVAGDTVTSNDTLHFLAPAKGERLRAKGLVVRAGRRRVVGRAELWPEAQPTLAAIATATITPLD